MTVLAAHPWPSNAALILDVHRLGYLRDRDHVLDPTYGGGLWWKKWRPEKLTTHDLALDGVDFRRLPHPTGIFDAAAYDPPYVAKGGRDTSGIPDMDRRYGQDNCPATPALLQALINEGLHEVARVVKRRGVVLVKCKDYVSSGRLWPGTHLTLTYALSCGLELVDRFEHLGLRGQPPRSRADGKPVVQQHARRNLSTLLVFRKPS